MMIQSSVIIRPAQTDARESGQSSVKKLIFAGKRHPIGEQNIPGVDTGNLLHVAGEIRVEK
jgi:hypothetical protein